MKPIIVELAGRDSVVSLIKFAEDVQTGQAFVLTVVKSPPEENTPFILNLGEILRIHLESMGHRVIEMVDIQDTTEYWMRLLNVNTGGKYKDIYAPCIACHALCHLMRLPILRKFESNTILTGERLNHQGVIKSNQSIKILDIYDEIFDRFGIKFLRPLKDIINTEIIEQRYNEFCDQYCIDNSNDLFRKCLITNKEKELPSNIREYCMDGLFPELYNISRDLTKIY